LSIVNTIGELVKAGGLVPYQPTILRPVHAQGPRYLWLTPETHKWVLPDAAHPDPRIGDEPLSHLGDQLNAFVAGEFMENGLDIKRLCPPKNDIWTIRSHLKQPQLRVFGWFVLPKLFVAAHYAVRDDLEKGKGPKWNAAIAKADGARTALVGSVDFYNVDPGEYVKNPK
jgi:hypothetical protein